MSSVLASVNIVKHTTSSHQARCIKSLHYLIQQVSLSADNQYRWTMCAIIPPHNVMFEVCMNRVQPEIEEICR